MVDSDSQNPIDFRAVFDLLNVLKIGFFQTKKTGSIIQKNQAFCEMLGYGAEENIDSREVGFPDFTLAQSQNSYQLQLKKKDGELLPVEVVVAPIVGPQEEIVSYICLVQDLFALKKSEDSVRLLEQHFRSLIENALDSVAILNIDGTVEYYGPSAVHVIGWDAEELVGKNGFELVHPEDLEKLKQLIQEILNDPENVRTAEYRFLHKDGTWHIIESVGKSFSPQSGVPRVLVNSRDITERRRLEQQLRTAGKMETVGRLAGGLAHDFNNILMAISSTCELMELKLNAGNPVFNELSSIQKETEQAASVVRKLLGFSQKEFRRAKIVGLNEIIENNADLIRHALSKNIELRLAFYPDLPKTKADSDQIAAALLNLAINARDAMPQGGVLEIRTDPVIFDSDFVAKHTGSKAGNYVLLEIKDNGYGMGEETLAHVFEPFFTTKPTVEGAGLGLSYVYGIVKQNQGYITCESKKGEGTIIRIYLPAEQ